MKKLKYFESAEAARLYSCPMPEGGKLVSSDMMTQFMVVTGLYAWFRSQTDDLCLALMDRVRTSSLFNFTTSSPVGVANISLIDQLALAHNSDPALSEKLSNLKLYLLGYANPVGEPYSEITDFEFHVAKRDQEQIVSNIPMDSKRHALEFELTDSLPLPVVIEVQQRYARTDDESEYTDWATCAKIPNVMLKQDSYKAMIPVAPALYRELRLVLPVAMNFELK